MTPTPQTQFACLACDGIDGHEPTCRHATLHDRIRAEVDQERSWQHRGVTEGKGNKRMLALCDHADRILDRHARSCGFFNCVEVPCIEVRDLAEAWGVEL